MKRAGVTDVTRELAREAFDKILERWPQEIYPGEKSFTLSGCIMRELNETHWPIEEWTTKTDFGPDLNEVIGIASWSIFQLIAGALKYLTVLPKSSIDFEAFVSLLHGHPNIRIA